jgi:HemY protein
MRLFIVVVELIALVAVAAWLVTQPGSVSLHWGEYHIESSLSVSFLGLAVVFLCLAFILKVWHFIVMLPANVYAYTQKLRPEKGLKALTQSVISTALEEYEQARVEAVRFERYLGDNAVYKGLVAFNYLQEGKLEDARKICETMKNDGDAKTLSWIMEARSALRDGKESLALGSLQSLYQLHEKSPWVIRQLLKCSLKLKLFEVGLDVLKKSERLGILTAPSIKRCKALIFFEQAELESVSLEQKERLLEQAHRLAPELVRVTVQYSKVLRLQDNPKRARKAIEQSWTLHPHGDLLDEYMAIDHEADPKVIMKTASRLVSFNEQDANSYLALAKFALKMQEWSRARAALHDYQEKHEMTTDFCYLMARLELSEHVDHGRYREWIEKAFQLVKNEGERNMGDRLDNCIL